MRVFRLSSFSTHNLVRQGWITDWHTNTWREYAIQNAWRWTKNMTWSESHALCINCRRWNGWMECLNVNTNYFECVWISQHCRFPCRSRIYAYISSRSALRRLWIRFVNLNAYICLVLWPIFLYYKLICIMRMDQARISDAELDEILNWFT